MNNRVLFVLTGHNRLGAADDADARLTGFHLAEAAQPWQVLTRAGVEVDIATPDGGEAPVDPASFDAADTVNAAFLGDTRVDEAIRKAPALSEMDLSRYDAIYFPGGHGTMWDLPHSEAVIDAIRTMWESGKMVAAVCHGPAALVNVRLADGSWLVDGKRVSVFTDEEERAVEKDDVVPFMLEKTLAQRGATIAGAPVFESSVSVDGQLITGQNPASARGVGEAMRDTIMDARKEAA